MKTRNAEILLAAVILARSTSFIMSKSGLDSLQPMNLLGVRFIIAFAVLVLIFRNKIIHMKRQTFINGVIIGAIYTAVMAAEMIGLKYADSSRIAFLENSAIVFVPIAESIIRRKAPSAISSMCTVMAIAGVGLLTLTNGFSGFGKGEAFGLIAALLYTSGIIVTDRLSKNDDGLLLGITQVGTMGILSMMASFAFETPVLPSTASDWGMILWLALVCTGFGFTLQPLAQKYIKSERTSMISALNPVSAGIMGSVFRRENLGISGILGAALVMAGILIQNVKTKKTSYNHENNDDIIPNDEDIASNDDDIISNDRK